MQERYLSTVDFGSSKIALSVVKIFGDDIQLIYYKETPSDGIRYSMVFNPTRAAEPLKAAIREAEEELGIKITQLVAGLPRYNIREYNGGANVTRSDAESCITKEEVELLKETALCNFNVEDYEKAEIYGAEAQSFNIDDCFQAPEEDIVGVPSQTLEGNFKVFLGAKRAVDNLDKVMNKAGIAIARKYFLPAMTARAVLTPEEIDNGVALVEMGAGVTSVTIYRNNILRHYRAIPFGGKNITADIKYECGYRETLAENIKMAFGACMPEKLQNMSEKIIQIVDEDGCCYPDLTVKYLSEIVTARCREIFEAILFAIQESGYADKLRNGIVLTGGCANLTNAQSLLREMSGYNVRIGYPRTRRISNCSSSIGETGAAATVGMILSGISDEWINCTSTEDIPGKGKEEEAVSEGTVFEQSVNPDEPESAKEKSKPAKKKKEHGSKLWNSFKVGLKDSYESTVGNLWDGMKDE